MNKYAPIFVIIAASLWGIDAIVLRPYLYNLPVPLVVFIESAIVALLLSPILFKRFNDIKSLKKKDLLIFFGVAMFGGAIGTMAITKALFYVNYVNLSIVVLIQKLQPLFALILAAILLKEKLPKEFFSWAGLAIIGAYFMTFGMNIPNLDTGDKTVEAALFALLAAFSFGFSTVLSKRALRNVTYEVGTYLRFLMTTILMFLIVLFLGQFSDIKNVTETQSVVFIIIAFTSGGLAIFLYYFGLKRITASVATIAELAFPLTAVLLEYILRGNMLGWSQWVGTVILLFSILRITRINISNK